MNFNDFILEAADVRDVDMLDIEVAQLIAEMSVIDAMMNCYEKQMILLEYNEDSAEEIFTESASITIPQMPEYFEEAYVFQAVKNGSTWSIKRFDKGNGARKLPGSDKWDPRTSKVFVDQNGQECSEAESSAAVLNNENTANQTAARLNGDESLTNPNKQTKNTNWKSIVVQTFNAAKTGKKVDIGTGDIDADMLDVLMTNASNEEKRKAREKFKKDEKAKQALEAYMDGRKMAIEAEAQKVMNDDTYKSRYPRRIVPYDVAIKIATARIAKKYPLQESKEWQTVDVPEESVKSTNPGRDYKSSPQQSSDLGGEKFETPGTHPREDVPKKSFMNGLKKLMSLLGDAAVKLGELIYDAMNSINFIKLGQAFGDRMNKANATTVTLNAKDAALIDGFDTFMKVVNGYADQFGPNKLSTTAGKWTNSNMGDKVRKLNEWSKQLDEMNKTDSDSDRKVEVSKITAICDKLGKNDVKKQLREFRRNSAAFKTNLNVEAGIPTELANEMRKFVKKLLSTYTAEAKAVKNILKIAKANDAVEENSESKEPAPVSAGGETKTEGWSMNLSEDEDFF